MEPTGIDALLARTEVAIVAGVVLAAALVALARRLGRRRELAVYALVLLLTAVYYLLAAMGKGAPPARVGVEALGAALFGAAAGYGVLRRPILLALGWIAHAGWDLFLHPAGAAAATLYVPAWYPMLCVGFDLLLGGYVAGIVLGGAGAWPPPRERKGGGKILGPRPIVH
jgi:hypothetical protein